jgi:prophage regulatory protein
MMPTVGGTKDPRGWRVSVRSAPIVDPDLVARVPEDLLEALLADRRVAGPVTSGPDEEGRVGATVAVDASDVLEAVRVAVGAVIEALARIGVAGGVDLLEAEPEDREASWRPELLGASDVARLLGVSRQRVYQLLEEREDFPRPAAELARGALWRRHEVEAWARARRTA